MTSVLGTVVPPCGISRETGGRTERAQVWHTVLYPVLWGLVQARVRRKGPGCNHGPLTHFKALRRPYRGRFRDVYSSVHRPFIHRLIHSVDEAVDSTRWGSIGSEHLRAHVLIHTDEHVGEASISSPPDEASAWRDVCVVHMRRDMPLELALDSSGGGALPHGSGAYISPVTGVAHVTVTGVRAPLCATFCCCVCSSSMCLA